MLTLSTTSFLFLFTVNLSDDAALLVLCVIYTKTIYVTVYTPCVCFVQTPADLQLYYTTPADKTISLQATCSRVAMWY